MKGVRFGDFHSYTDWGLLLVNKEIKSPEPKINQIEIEGSDGVLDLTEFFGEVKYKNRSLSFQFAKMNIVQRDFLELYSRVQNAIHGRMTKVTIDDDPNYYYYGRVTINEWKSNKNLGEIVIEVDAEPYKYRNTETMGIHFVTDGREIVLLNSQKRVVPTITTDAAFTISFGNYSGSFSAGTFTIPELELIEGETTVTVKGTGTITFKYREGEL